MNNSATVDIARNASGGYKVDASRGERIGRVSSEWFNRPADERFLCLSALMTSVHGRSERSRTRIVDSAAISVEASRDDAERLDLVLPGADRPVAPTNWSFGQLASIVGAPAAYLRQLPAPLAGINLQYGLAAHRAEQIKTLEIEGGRVELRAVTGPDYGRIYDHELVAAVQKIAGDGVSDTRWKIPGVLDWSTGIYNPRVDITSETTTLYASDRDVFLFLVDDLNPIEAGRLPDGSPDLYFRGFYCWNSEVGAKTLGIASFYLRAVCQNRNLWGVEEFEEISIRHSKYAASRFANDVAPALTRFANSSPLPFVKGSPLHAPKLVARREVGCSIFLHEEVKERVRSLEPYVFAGFVGNHHQIKADDPPVGCCGNVVNGFEYGRAAKAVKACPQLVYLRWRRGKTCSGFDRAISPSPPNGYGAIALRIADNDAAKIVRRGA